MKQESAFHQSITVFPNKTVYAGEHARDGEIGLQSKYLGKFNTDVDILKAKTHVNQELTGLFSKIIGDQTQSLPRLTASTSVANSENLTHLQLIKLFPEAQGTPINYFWLDNMFKVRDIPMLEYREPFHDVSQTAEYVGRLESTKNTSTKYDEIVYNLQKLSDKVYTPIEDILRTIINPQTIDMAMLQWGMKRKRNQEALEKGLKKIGNTQSAIGSFSTIGTNYHSTNRSASELNDMFVQFLRKEDVGITHVAMNNTLFQAYTENTWTKSGPNDINAQRLSNGGVVPLPGFSDGKMAVIDSSLPDNMIYCVNKDFALRLGEGPKIMRRYRDEDKDAEAIKVIDFNQYMSTNDQISKIERNFGMTIPVSA